MTKAKKFYKFSRETMRFETELEKEIHKKISNARLGTNLEFALGDDEDSIIRSIKKSLFYNNIECRMRISSNRDKVVIHFEY